MPAELNKINFIIDEAPDSDTQMDRATVGKERERRRETSRELELKRLLAAARGQQIRLTSSLN